MKLRKYFGQNTACEKTLTDRNTWFVERGFITLENSACRQLQMMKS